MAELTFRQLKQKYGERACLNYFGEELFSHLEADQIKFYPDSEIYLMAQDELIMSDGIDVEDYPWNCFTEATWKAMALNIIEETPGWRTVTIGRDLYRFHFAETLEIFND